MLAGFTMAGPAESLLIAQALRTRVLRNSVKRVLITKALVVVGHGCATSVLSGKVQLCWMIECRDFTAELDPHSRTERGQRTWI